MRRRFVMNFLLIFILHKVFLFMEIIKDLGNGSFIARDREGKEITLKTIVKGEVERSRKERIRKVAKKANPEIVDIIHRKSKLMMNTIIDIDEWYELAEEFGNLLNRFDETIENISIFHHSVKNIHPECYGKANTFRKECKYVTEMCEEI